MALDWSRFTGQLFQDLCLDLLSAEGFGVEDRGLGPDGGVDALLSENAFLPDGSVRILRWISQFKFKTAPSATVGPAELGNVANLLLRFHGDGFFLVTNGRVTAKTTEELRATVRALRPRAASSIWTGRHIVARLEYYPAIARRYFPDWCPPKRQAIPVEVLISTSFDEFSELQQRLLVHALAEFLDISPQAVRIRKVEPGSTRVVVELPIDAARLLTEAFEGGYLDLESLGFREEVVSVSIDNAEKAIWGSASPPVSEDFESAPMEVYLNQRADETFALLRRAADRMLSTFFLRDLYDAEDLAMDTFIRLRQGAKNVEYRLTPAEFHGRAYAAERRTLLDRSRMLTSVKRGATFARALVDVESIDLREETGLERALMVDIDRALRKLHEEQPELAILIQMRYYAGYTIREASSILGTSRSVAYSRVKVGLKWLNRYLGGKGILEGKGK